MNPLHVLTYDIFLNKYGLIKVTETKYNQVKHFMYPILIWKKFYESAIHYSSKNLRLNLFCRFSSLIEPYDTDEYHFYLESLKYFD